MNPRLKRLTLYALLAITAPGLGWGRSLWRSERNAERGLIANRVAARVGDPLTIKIDESNAFTTTLAKGSNKSSNVNDTLTKLLFSPTASDAFTKNGELPGMQFAGNNTFSAGGNVNNTRKLTATMVVMVIDELPNSNLVVEGSRTLGVDGETQYAVVSGIVRPEDIDASNAVSSDRVANLSVQIFPEGTISQAQRRGLISGAYTYASPL